MLILYFRDFLEWWKKDLIRVYNFINLEQLMKIFTYTIFIPSIFLENTFISEHFPDKARTEAYLSFLIYKVGIAQVFPYNKVTRINGDTTYKTLEQSLPQHWHKP